MLLVEPILAMHEAPLKLSRQPTDTGFLIQPAPSPERMVAPEPVPCLRSVMGSWHAGLAAFDARALARCERCIALPGNAASICEDYRASATVNWGSRPHGRRNGRRDRGPKCSRSSPLQRTRTRVPKRVFEYVRAT